MPKPPRFSAALLFLSGTLALVSTACSNSPFNGPAVSAEQVSVSSASSTPVSEAMASPAALPASNNSTPAVAASSANQPASSPEPDPYRLALERANSAFNIGQSAQSQDDWRLVASRWQQAIQLMQSVPTSNPNQSLSRSKVTEYQRNLAYAQQQANRSTALPNPDGVLILPQSVPQPVAPPRSNRVVPPQPASNSRRVYRAQILRRAGGTPIIAVTFNGSQTHEMIVDTGASGTLITQQMAIALRVVPVGAARVATASARDVQFPLGYVSSVQVDGAIAQNLLVAVAGPELDVGLLGHDFFGNYDVTIGRDVVEFRER